MHPLLKGTVLTAALAASGLAQVIPVRPPKLSDQWVFGLNGFGGVPVGDFRRAEVGGAGGELSVGFQPLRRAPLVIRGSAGSLVYGYYNRDRRQYGCDMFNNCGRFTVFYNSRYHNMSFFQVGPELMATDGTWRPFIYALAGVTLFNSWANYGQPDYYGNAPSTTLFHSHNPSSAYGLGIRKVGTSLGRESGWEFSLRLIRNPDAAYLSDRGISQQADGSWDIAPNYGAANVVGLHVGYWVGPFVNWYER